MKLSPKMRQLLVKEIEFAISKINSTENFTEKLYYFSIVYATTNRVMNIEFDPELVLIHQVLSSSYNMINSSMKLMREGQLVATIEKDLFNNMSASLVKLANNFKNEESTYIVLQEIANLAYSTCGNGHYLVLKGFL